MKAYGRIIALLLLLEPIERAYLNDITRCGNVQRNRSLSRAARSVRRTYFEMLHCATSGGGPMQMERSRRGGDASHLHLIALCRGEVSVVTGATYARTLRPLEGDPRAWHAS